VRNERDALRSMHKYVAKALEVADPDAGWEVRLWDEEGTFRAPFARVATIGPVIYGGGSSYWTEVTQPMAVHLYPQHDDPNETAEGAVLRAAQVRGFMRDAFQSGVRYLDPIHPPQFTSVEVVGAGTGIMPPGVYYYGVAAIMPNSGQTLQGRAVAEMPNEGDVFSLEWSPVVGVDHYRVYKGTTPNNMTIVGETVTTSMIDGAPYFPASTPAPVEASALHYVSGFSERVPLYDFDGAPLDGPLSDSTARHPSDFMRIVRGSFSVNELPDPVDDRLRTIIADMRVTWKMPTRTITGKPVQSVVTAFDAVI
jgi:hypothetical protein